MPETGLVWLRNDLRIADNPALAAAIARGGGVVAIHIEATDATLRKRGAASRWWLHHSLNAVARDLAAIAGPEPREPIVDLKGSRERAQEAFKTL